MAWYAQYYESDGTLFAVVSGFDPNQLPVGVAVQPIAHRPTESEKWDKATHSFVARTASKAEAELLLVEPYTVWKMWKDTLVEATARSLPATALTALTNKTNTVWTEYVAAIEAWRNA
jgi:hypothetical protein